MTFKYVHEENLQEITVIMTRIKFASPLSPVFVFRPEKRSRGSKMLCCYFGDTVMSKAMLLHDEKEDIGKFVGAFHNEMNQEMVRKQLEMALLI